MALSARVVDVVSEWGSLYVLLRDGRVSWLILAHTDLVVANISTCD